MENIKKLSIGLGAGILLNGILSIVAAVTEGSSTGLTIVIVLITLLTAALFFRLISLVLKKISWHESILDAMPFPLSITDMNMNWTFINKPVEQMLKVRRADVIGKHCSNWGAGICKTDNCGITCLRANKEVTYFEQAGMNFQVNTAYLNNNGQKIGHIEVVQDISTLSETQNIQKNLINSIKHISSDIKNTSHTLADASQALAQGSTEQAASIEQLSSSVSEMSDQTKDNAEMASKAATLAETIKANAEQSSEFMAKMTQSVQEINDASVSISKIIKVINDIAFQTNILALNAAVEAARAGEAGKGFAVVADEVRNLAAKSAEAANDTDSLITNSMAKTELGASIAVETADSLSKIIEGINESAELVGDIAKSSESQSIAISQISLGIEQVAQVVQQNSATAEESAASITELSEHSAELDNLVYASIR